MGGKPRSRRYLAVGGLAAAASIVLGGCHESPVSSQVTYTDECQVTYADGNQSTMEDCDTAQNQASNTPGASVQQMIVQPDGTEQWVPPTGDWG